MKISVPRADSEKIGLEGNKFVFVSTNSCETSNHNPCPIIFSAKYFEDGASSEKMSLL